MNVFIKGSIYYPFTKGFFTLNQQFNIMSMSVINQTHSYISSINKDFCYGTSNCIAKLNIFLFFLLISFSLVAQSNNTNSGIEVDEGIATLYFENQPEWTDNFNFLCLNDACVSGTLNTATNRWERQVNATVGQTYQIQIKISSSVGGQYISDQITVTAQQAGSNNPDPQPSCNDGIQNQGETGIDCGGPCTPCDNPNPNPEEETVIQAESGSLLGSAQYYNDGAATNGQGVAYISSPGAGFALQNVPSASSVQLKYASQQSGTLSVFVNGNDAGNINFSSNGSWVGNYTTATLEVNVPQGATFEIIYQSGDAAMNVDELTFIGQGQDPDPTCDDGILNNGETEIDCGGPNCDPCDNPPVSGPVIALTSNNEKGTFLVGGQDANQPGFSLYTFDNDNNSLPFSDCYNGCETTWPPVTVQNPEDLIITNQVNNTFTNGFGLSARCDGSLQVTYDNKPLYYFANDNTAGDTNGDNVNGVWHLVANQTDPEPCTGIDTPTANVTKTNETTPNANDGSITFNFEDDANNGGTRTNIEFSIDGGNTYPYNVPDNSGSTTVNNLAPGTYQIYARWGNNECPTFLQNITINQGDDTDPCNDPNPDPGVEGDNFIMGLNSDGVAYHQNVSHNPSFFVINLNGQGGNVTINNEKGRREAQFSNLVAGQTYTLEVRIQGDNYSTGQCIHSIQVQLGQGVDSTPCTTSNDGGGNPPVTLPDPVLAVGSNTQLGAFLIGASGSEQPGFSMYTTSGNCTGDCLDNWPPVLVDDPDLVNNPGGITNTVDAVPFGDVNCTPKFHVTLDDQKLYFYSGDNASGDTNGHNLGPWRIASVNRLPKAPDAKHLMSALKTPINGRTPGNFGWVHDINGRNVAVRAGSALQLQFHASQFVGGVGSVLTGFGDPDWTFVCSCNQVEFYEAEMTITDYGRMTVEIPGNCYDKFYYFFRYKKAGLPTDDLGTQMVYSTLFEYDERNPNDRIDPADQGQITSNSANWMRFRHPRAHDGNTELIFNSQNNAGRVRALDRYSTTVTTGGSGTTINADLPNILRIEALDNGLIRNSNPAYVYNTNTCCGTNFDYGNVITYEITIGSGAQISSQIYNTFQHVVVGKGFDSSLGDPRLTMAGKASTTMEFSTSGSHVDLEMDAIFTQHLTTLTSAQDVDDFLEGHHLFHGLQDQFEVIQARPNFGSAKIGTRACQDCHFRDGRGSQVELTRDGEQRVPPPVYGTGLLQYIEGAEAGLTWNGDVSTVRQQVSNALLQDHGVQSSSLGNDFDLLVAYTEFLTVPNRNAAAYLDPDVEDGDRIFREVSCTSCHQPTQKTSSSAPAEFRNLIIRPYTDMKMHTVTDEPYRTPPLWGLGRNIDLLERNGKALILMHDGRATSLEGAIQAHGGEASDSRSRYNALSASDKTKLIKFLKTL